MNKMRTFSVIGLLVFGLTAGCGGDNNTVQIPANPAGPPSSGPTAAAPEGGGGNEGEAAAAAPPAVDP